MKTRHLFSDNHATMSMTSKLRGGDEAHRALVCRVATDLRAAVFVTRPPWCSRSLCAKQLAARKCALPNGCSAQTSAQSFNGIRTQGHGSAQVLATKQRERTPRNAVILEAQAGVISVPFDSI